MPLGCPPSRVHTRLHEEGRMRSADLLERQRDGQSRTEHSTAFLPVRDRILDQDPQLSHRLLHILDQVLALLLRCWQG